MLIRGAAGALVFILLNGAAALATEASPGDTSAPSQEAQAATQAPAAPAASASGVSAAEPAPFPLPALPADYLATTPHLFGEWRIFGPS